MKCLICGRDRGPNAHCPDCTCCWPEADTFHRAHCPTLQRRRENAEQQAAQDTSHQETDR